jgi:sugar lactone lactonase YvrE
MRLVLSICAIAGILSAELSVAGDEPQTLEQRVAFTEGLSGPEAVHWDADQGVWFVSNFNGAAAGDANGFVSKLSANGEIIDLRFMVGSDAVPLHGPRGMRIQGDTLWVADADGLHAFDRRSGEQLQFVDFTDHEPGFLNDIDIGPDGALYLTDTGNARVFKVVAESISVVADDELVSPPNGILWSADAEAMVLAPWSGGLTLQTYRLKSNDLGEYATLPAGGNIDGLEFWQGALIAASQVDQSIWALQDGQARVLVKTPGRPADIGLNDTGVLAVPYIALDRVDFWQLPE